MDRINLEDTQESLADVIARVESGETVVVARGGEVVARIEALNVVPEASRLEPVDVEALRRLTSKMTPQNVSAGEFMRWMRDTDRY